MWDLQPWDIAPWDVPGGTFVPPSIPPAAYTHLRDLLPPGRSPVVGGTADGIVRMLGTHEAELAVEAIRTMELWFAAVAPLEWLDIIGAGRGIWRWPNESADQYRQRVVDAYEYWRWGGTLRGIKAAFERIGYDAVPIEIYRFDPSRWAQFALLIAALTPRTTTDYDDGQFFDAGPRYDAGSGPTADESVALRQLVRDLKPGHTRLASLTFVGGTRVLCYDVPANLFDAGLSWPYQYEVLNA